MNGSSNHATNSLQLRHCMTMFTLRLSRWTIAVLELTRTKDLCQNNAGIAPNFVLFSLWSFARVQEKRLSLSFFRDLEFIRNALAIKDAQGTPRSSLVVSFRERTCGVGPPIVPRTWNGSQDGPFEVKDSSFTEIHCMPDSFSDEASPTSEKYKWVSRLVPSTEATEKAGGFYPLSIGCSLCHLGGSIVCSRGWWWDRCLRLLSSTSLMTQLRGGHRTFPHALAGPRTTALLLLFPPERKIEPRG